MFFSFFLLLHRDWKVSISNEIFEQIWKSSKYLSIQHILLFGSSITIYLALEINCFLVEIIIQNHFCRYCVLTVKSASITVMISKLIHTRFRWQIYCTSKNSDWVINYRNRFRCFSVILRILPWILLHNSSKMGYYSEKLIFETNWIKSDIVVLN